MTLRLRLLNLWLQRVEKPWLARVPEPAEARRSFERAARLLFPDPPGALYLEDRLGAIPALWASAGCGTGGPEIILYFHGGGYVMGSPQTHKAMLAQLSRLTGRAACLPDYRKAPETPFPAAVEDARAAWEALLARGYDPARIMLGGDSAGGGLALALLCMLCRAGGDLPAGLFALSPWTDLTLSGASLDRNAEIDRLLPANRVTELRDYYVGAADPSDPRASPLFGRYPGCPPVFLQAARTEILHDDVARMAERLRAEGARVTFDLWEDLPHVWPIFQGTLPEADAALARVARFVDGRLTPE